MKEDLSGMRFRRLTVIEAEPSPFESHTVYLCYCSCGCYCYVRSDLLLSGRQVSCGCYKAEGWNRKDKAERKWGISVDRNGYSRTTKKYYEED